MTVWVTQETSHDFTPAEAWGEIRFMTRDDLSNMKNSLRNDALVTELGRVVNRFDPNVDWVVIAGSPYVSAMFFTLFGFSRHRQLRILRWDNRDLRYIPLVVDIPR